MENIQYKNKILPVAMMDPVIKKHKPCQIYLFYKKKYYLYNKGYDLNFFIHFVNRHLYPVVILKSIQDVEDFRNTSIEWRENTPFYTGVYRSIKDVFQDMTKITRVIAFVSHKSEYSYELKELNKIAKELGFRDDLRIAKVTDVDIIKHYKFDLQKKWFDTSSMNSIVAFTRGEHKEQYYDLAAENYDISLWLNAASVDAVENMTVQSLQVMETMDMPIWVAFVDTKHEKYGIKSTQLIEDMKEMIPDYPYFLFGYFEDRFFDYKKKQIGIDWDELPALALLNPPSEGYVILPKDTPLTKNNLKILFEKGVDNVMNNETIRYPDESYNMSRHLRVPDEITPENYKEAFNHEQDVCLLIFNPGINYENASSTAENFGMAARLLNDLKIRFIKFMYFDMNQHVLPEEFKQFNFTIPYVLLIPKNDKSRIHVKHTELQPQEIMIFVRDSATDEVKFPDHKSLNKKQTKDTFEIIELESPLGEVVIKDTEKKDDL